MARGKRGNKDGPGGSKPDRKQGQVPPPGRPGRNPIRRPNPKNRRVKK